MPEFSPDKCVSPHLPLELDKAVNNLVSIGAVRVEQCRAMVSFNECYCASRPEGVLKFFEGEERIGQVLEKKADEYMVEGFRPKGKW